MAAAAATLARARGHAVPASTFRGSVDNKTPVEVVRISSREQWFPEHFYEVVAHRRDGGVVVTVVATRAERSSAHLEYFDCAERESCLRDLRLWLARLAQESIGADERLLGWVNAISQRIADALFRPS